MSRQLGAYEQLVLLALIHLDDEAYGVAVQREIAQRTGRATSFATVYTTLNRLEAKGLITSRLGDATAERGGRRKRFFSVLAPGRKAVRASLHELRTMLRGLDTTWSQP